MNDNKKIKIGEFLKENIFFAVMLTACALVYYVPFKYMIGKWIEGFDTSYSPGPFAPIVSGYVVWLKKDFLLSMKSRSSAFGFLIIVFSLLAHMIAQIGDLQQISVASFVFLLFGLFVSVKGWAFAFEMLFPLGFLLFMIPMEFLDTMVGVPLRIVASEMAAFIMEMLGLDIIQIGTHIQLIGVFSFDVAAPCSGLKSLVSLVALGIAYAYITQKSNWKRVTIVLSAVPVAILANVFRIVLMGLIAVSCGEKLAVGFFHSFSGFFLFSFALGAMALIGGLLSCPWKKRM